MTRYVYAGVRQSASQPAEDEPKIKVWLTLVDEEGHGARVELVDEKGYRVSRSTLVRFVVDEDNYLKLERAGGINGSLPVRLEHNGRIASFRPKSPNWQDF